MSETRLVVLVSSTVLIVLVAFLLKFLSFRRNERRNSKLPPGNMGWPLIGETFSFLKPRSPNSVGEFMERRISRFGRIFMTNLAGKPTIVSAEAGLNRFVVQNDLRLFEPAWSSSALKLLGENSIGVAVGDEHKYLRSIAVTFLSSARVRSVFLRDAEQMATQLLSSLKEGSVISVVDVAKKFTFGIMAKNSMSMTPWEPEVEKLMGELEASFKGLCAIPLNMPGTTYRKALQSRTRIANLIKQKMEDRIQKNGDGIKRVEEDDLLGWIMENTNYSWEQIGDLLLGVLIAGYDTTSRIIPLAIYFLESCPKAIEQLREEYLEAVRRKKQGGEGKLTWDEYKQMEFTQCVINETLRLGNVATFIRKKASTDIQFKGYEIPRGYVVMTNFAAVHLDPSLFEDPHHFNPWRWLRIKKSNNFMPFSGGTRHCPGAELARLEMTVFLHHLILNYNWELTEPDHPIAYPLPRFPKGLRITVQKLSPES